MQRPSGSLHFRRMRSTGGQCQEIFVFGTLLTSRLLIVTLLPFPNRIFFFTIPSLIHNPMKECKSKHPLESALIAGPAAKITNNYVSSKDPPESSKPIINCVSFTGKIEEMHFQEGSISDMKGNRKKTIFTCYYTQSFGFILFLASQQISKKHRNRTLTAW